MDSPEKQDMGPVNPMVERLILETGITREQARDLVTMLGVDWSSLVREAQLLRSGSALPW